MEVGGVEVDVREGACSRGRPRKAFTCSSRPWQIRLTSDLEMPPAVAVAMGGALIGATLVELGAGECGNLGLQQGLEPTAHDLTDQGASGGAIHELVQLGGATMGEAHGLCSVWW